MKKQIMAICIAAVVGILAGCEDDTHHVTVAPPPPPPVVPELPDPPTPPVPSDDYLVFGAGNVATKFNPAGYGCSEDHGSWINSAGVVMPGVAGCDSNGAPIGDPTPLTPQVTGPAAEQPVATHRWWGSVSFLGEMKVGNVNDAAYITPDPVIARISNRGARISSIPSGLRQINPNEFGYTIPDPFAEVFDGLAVGNTEYSELEASLKESSDGAMTVQWQADGTPVMEATFVHGSPYVFFKAVAGELAVRTLREDGGEKSVFLNDGNTLGISTNVAGNQIHYLIVGEGETTFGNVTGNDISVTNAAKEFTLAVLPGGDMTSEKIAYFSSRARNVVARVDINYEVAKATSDIQVSHTFLNSKGEKVSTIAGLFPMHWKNAATTVTAPYSVRSARGVVKYQQIDGFSYQLPFVGVLPYMPTEVGDYDLAKLKGMINAFIAEGRENWNVYDDTYWSGKIYGKVAELAAISRSLGMTAETELFTDWLKAELSDWFTANTSGGPDVEKYFVYDEKWDTLLGVKESFAAHQQLNDHHFHYGYFVRAAAEICRVDTSWCGQDQFGPMVELLIRDYAADRDDDMFPYLRHFDPANGFSWASGQVNFTRGNNNESTSEAANAYGAMVLYGLITENQPLVDRGMYLHASTAESYWQYWNNIDRYKGKAGEFDNFPTSYEKMTTSIIWGDGAVFSTWFSPLYAHILGIQGLPSNPLTLYIAQYPDYMKDYTSLGLSESSNNKPSGLGEDQWRDIWWNLWAMSDADAAIADYNTMPDYIPEAGESKAHTYHWLHTWKNLGQMLAHEDRISANDPAAVVFDKSGVKTYVAYNYSDAVKTVTFSDGTVLTVPPDSFETMKK